MKLFPISRAHVDGGWLVPVYLLDKSPIAWECAAKPERQLVIDFGDGTEDEYQIQNRHFVFRSRRAGKWNPWRRLSADDILMHLTLHTVVGKWLMLRLPRRTRNTWHLLTKFTQ